MQEERAGEKESLRRRLIAARRQVPSETRRQWSAAICRGVCASEAFGRATHLVAYAPMGAEVDPSAAAVVALELGRPLYYPSPSQDAAVRRSDVVAAAVGDLDDSGEPLTLDHEGVLFLIPGVAFDSAGRRLGRGRGWYDKLLGRVKLATRVGLAFELQIVRRVPIDSWDVPMHVLVTERRSLAAGRSHEPPEGTIQW
jgi:5-formyltetrahydrofolate cyclo-ligase